MLIGPLPSYFHSPTEPVPPESIDMPSFSKPSPGDSLAMFISVLKIAKGASDALSSVPLLGVITGALLGLT